MVGGLWFRRWGRRSRCGHTASAAFGYGLEQSQTDRCGCRGFDRWWHDVAVLWWMCWHGCDNNQYVTGELAWLESAPRQCLTSHTSRPVRFFFAGTTRSIRSCRFHAMLHGCSSMWSYDAGLWLFFWMMASKMVMVVCVFRYMVRCSLSRSESAVTANTISLAIHHGDVATVPYLPSWRSDADVLVEVAAVNRAGSTPFVVAHACDPEHPECP